MRATPVGQVLTANPQGAARMNPFHHCRAFPYPLRSPLDLSFFESGAAGYAAALRRALYTASREKDKQVGPLGCTVLSALLKAGSRAGGEGGWLTMTFEHAL